MGATVRPIKTADQAREKSVEPTQLPIADMIMQNIDKITIAPGVWSKLCNDHLMLNEQITQTHENELKGPDLSIAALKRERYRYILPSNSFKTSPSKGPKSGSRMASRRSSLHSRQKSTKSINRVKFVKDPSNVDAEIR